MLKQYYQEVFLKEYPEFQHIEFEMLDEDYVKYLERSLGFSRYKLQKACDKFKKAFSDLGVSSNQVAKNINRFRKYINKNQS